MKRLLRGAAVLALVPLAIAAGGRDSFVLFTGSFDNSLSNINAEVGQFFAWATDSTIVQIVADQYGGNELVIDDTAQSQPASVVLAGGFAGYKAVGSGQFQWSFEVTFASPDTPFIAGMVVDNPTSDFIPATGPDGNGMLQVASKPTNFTVPAGVPLEIDVTLVRDDPADDWDYEIVVEERANSPDPSSIQVFEGRLPNTGGRNVIGFAFEKSAAKAGRITVDQVSASTTSPMTSGI